MTFLFERMYDSVPCAARQIECYFCIYVYEIQISFSLLGTTPPTTTITTKKNLVSMEQPPVAMVTIDLQASFIHL